MKVDFADSVQNILVLEGDEAEAPVPLGLLLHEPSVGVDLDGLSPVQEPRQG